MSRFAHSTKIAALALAGVALVTALPTASQAKTNGAAVAAGVMGGLLLGGLLASQAQASPAGYNDYYAPPPPPPPAYPAYRPAPAYGPAYSDGYGPPPAYYQPRPRRPRCWTETQTNYNRWGQPYYQDVQVCR